MSLFNPLPSQKFSIILADPPWSYGLNGKKHSRWAGSTVPHYSTLSVSDICTLPVAEIAADNCILFLWATFPCIAEALKVIEAWGFCYKTVGFTWIKFYPKAKTPFFGVGYYTKSNAEICLIAVKGKPPKVSNSVSSIVMTPRGKHSEKPNEVRERIVQLCGDIPRIELFARTNCSGWLSWGLEAPGSELVESSS